MFFTHESNRAMGSIALFALAEFIGHDVGPKLPYRQPHPVITGSD
ncbi:hypothetical protein [Phaeodactylibacter luteus]|nr:hypothetical protein [Phaeodactylibacter luteus]